jgi:hypothetical protein
MATYSLTTDSNILAADLRTWLIDNAPADIRGALADACATRGKCAGRLRASAPKGESARGAWYAVRHAAGITGGEWSTFLAPGPTYGAVTRWLAGDPRARIVVLSTFSPNSPYLAAMGAENVDVAREWFAAQGIDPEYLGF